MALSADGETVTGPVRFSIEALPGTFARRHCPPDPVLLRRAQCVLAALGEDGATPADPFGGLLVTATVGLEGVLREEDVERIAQAIALQLPVPRVLNRRRQPKTVCAGE
jgi:hypothetical protein